MRGDAKFIQRPEVCREPKKVEKHCSKENKIKSQVRKPNDKKF
jgi:hypothetical protein